MKYFRMSPFLILALFGFVQFGLSARRECHDNPIGVAGVKCETIGKLAEKSEYCLFKPVRHHCSEMCGICDMLNNMPTDVFNGLSIGRAPAVMTWARELKP